MTVDELRVILDSLPGDLPVKLSIQSPDGLPLYGDLKTTYTKDTYQPVRGIVMGEGALVALVLDNEEYHND